MLGLMNSMDDFRVAMEHIKSIPDEEVPPLSDEVRDLVNIKIYRRPHKGLEPEDFIGGHDPLRDRPETEFNNDREGLDQVQPHPLLGKDRSRM
jgi:hypothetical protein